MRFTAFQAAALFVLRLAAAPGAYAQEAEPARPTAAILPSVDLAPRAESAGLRDIIGTTLAARLEEAGFRVVQAGAELERELESLPVLERAAGGRIAGAAGRLGAELVLAGYHGLDGARLFVQIKAYAAGTGELVAGRIAAGLAGLAAFDLINTAVGEILPELELWKKRRSPAAAAAPPARLVFTSADDGVEVLLGGRLPLGRTSGGTLAAPGLVFEEGARVYIEARREGHYPRGLEYKLERGKPGYELPSLKRKTAADLALFSTLGQLPGAGMAARFYPVPDYFFLQLSDYFYVQHDFKPGNHPVLHDELAAAFGGYVIFPHDSFFRVYLSAGLGAWLTVFSVPRMPWYWDFFVNFLNFGLELNLGGLSLFLESQGKFTFNTGTGLLGQNMLSSWRGPPPLAAGVRLR